MPCLYKPHFLDTYLGTELSKRYAYWYARMQNDSTEQDCGIWQYTSTGSVPGIIGNVDLDLGYTGLSFGHKEGRSESPFRLFALSVAGSRVYHLCDPGRRYPQRNCPALWHTVTALTQLNKLSDPDRIYAGNTIKVPESGSDISSSPQYYTIRSGDTLSEIAQEFGTSVSALTRLNGISQSGSHLCRYQNTREVN